MGVEWWISQLRNGVAPFDQNYLQITPSYGSVAYLGEHIVLSLPTPSSNSGFKGWILT